MEVVEGGGLENALYSLHNLNYFRDNFENSNLEKETK